MVDDVDKSKRVRKVKKVEEGGKATSKATTSKPKRKKARKKRVPKKEVNEIVVPPSPAAYKKKSIPEHIRTLVWNLRIGDSVSSKLETKCLAKKLRRRNVCAVRPQKYIYVISR